MTGATIEPRVGGPTYTPTGTAEEQAPLDEGGGAPAPAGTPAGAPRGAAGGPPVRGAMPFDAEAAMAAHNGPNREQARAESAAIKTQTAAQVAAAAARHRAPDGLKVGPEGFPAGSVMTEGGFVIVPKGNAEVLIFGPGQKPEDTPLTRIWGDPHVDEADGTKWDFTKGSHFALPDGTLLRVHTSAESGASFTQGIDIVNGGAHVTMSGLDTGQPTTSELKKDGWEYVGNHFDPNRRDTFYLMGLEPGKVDWVRQRQGNVDGTVTSGYMDAAQNAYDQTTSGAPAQVEAANLSAEEMVEALQDPYFDAADGLDDGQVTRAGLVAALMDPNATKEQKAIAKQMLDDLDGR